MGIMQWLAMHSIPIGMAIALVAGGSLWITSVVAASDGADDAGGFAALGVLGMIAGFFASLSTGTWAPWIPYLTGVVGLPLIIGVIVLIAKTPGLISQGWEHLKKWDDEANKRHAAEVAGLEKAELARVAAEAKTPKAVIARCEEVVKRYIAALPQDLQVIEERRQAETKLDALRGLYKLLGTIEKLGADNDESFKKHLADADALFSDVSLEKECGALVRELRERSVTKAPPVLRIHTAIEALVLSIHALPGKAVARIAEQTPTEYRISADDLQAEMGRPVLPHLDDEMIEPLPGPSSHATPLRSARKQLA